MLSCAKLRIDCQYARRYVVSNETRAPIANPPNSAQLGYTPIIAESYIRVRAVVWECGEG